MRIKWFFLIVLKIIQKTGPYWMVSVFKPMSCLPLWFLDLTLTHSRFTINVSWRWLKWKALQTRVLPLDKLLYSQLYQELVLPHHPLTNKTKAMALYSEKITLPGQLYSQSSGLCLIEKQGWSASLENLPAEIFNEFTYKPVSYTHLRAHET